MIKFYKTDVLGAISNDQYFVTRKVLIHIPVRNWLTVMNQQNPERRAEIWAEIEADANQPRAVSNDIAIARKIFPERTLALVAGTKIKGSSPKSGKILGEFKYIIVDDEALLETLRQEFGVKISRNATWDQVRQMESLERR